METRRERYQKQIAGLNADRDTFIPTWRELCDNFSQRRARFYTQDVNKGDRRNNKILNTKPLLALTTSIAGMMAGITSPSRPWFSLTTQDPKLNDLGDVKRWCATSTEIIGNVLRRSNVYTKLNSMYRGLLVYGISPMSLEENFTRVLYAQSFPIGGYRIAQDPWGRVNTFSRDFRMTVRQIVHKFGQVNDAGKIDFTNISRTVQDAWENGNYEWWIGLTHMIQPNDYFDKDLSKIDSKFQKFASCYWEMGSSTGSVSSYDSGAAQNLFLHEKGYKKFPLICPRWEVEGEDVYPTNCPGMTAIGDAKQLQYGERRSAEVIEKKVRPPLVGPASLQNKLVNQLPGGVTYVDGNVGNQKLEALFSVNQSIEELEQKQREIENRVDRAFFVDLFRAISEQIQRQDVTATFVNQLHTEALQELGPVLENIDPELDHLIDLAFDYCSNQRLLPPLPTQLRGQPLKIEYMSSMHMAQKALNVGTIERFSNFANQNATVNPQLANRVNGDKMLEIYADSIGLDPKIIRTDEEVQAITAAQQQAAAIQQRQQQVAQAAQTAQTLSKTDTQQPSALKAMVDQANAGGTSQVGNALA